MNNKQQLLAQYDMHCRWFKNALAGFTDEEANRRLNSQMNHVKYIAGHLFNSQYAFTLIAGLQVERKWEDLFAGQGKTKAKDNFPYPTIAEIQAEWDKLQPVIQKALEALPEEALGIEISGSPVAGKGLFKGSVGDLWAFLNMHQAYHIGQLGILRRGFGKEAMKYF